ncbi:uncharacterized protein DUF116 [Fontibacillus phaseoli]|uniref:Uncharacterized protein DUF116 n=1 Tax=Fontibacillus phaseoli TaxID=1416533 RepID=A0A369BGM6_9BACL|nr:DUF116 domain-containing protein [Fontibacillus phaseoli]RCX20699.1 uncharacterized protein DUF116 [Fontibacillus phaseoli]
MEAVTYSLYGSDAKGTDKYYEDIERFTDEVIRRLEKEPAVSQFSSYAAIRHSDSGDPLVHGLEFLMLGVLWISYGSRAAFIHKYGGKLLAGVYGWKTRGDRIRAIIERTKGTLNPFLLRGPQQVEPKVSMNRFADLIGWLQATGEFEQESRRMSEWLVFLKSRSREDGKRKLSQAVTFGKWFEARSREVLGRHTANVELYIDKNNQRLKWKENMIFCTRGRAEYHLNMVGAEIMNRAFREKFLNTEQKRVLLPICMREKGEAGCRAVESEHGYVCRSCSKDCQVKIISDLGKKHDFQVFMIPHASTAFGRQSIQPGKVGIVGVACILNLVSGGYQAKRLGYEPQCVLLNYSGCIKHWHETGVVTDIDLSRLLNRIQVGTTG